MACCRLSIFNAGVDDGSIAAHRAVIVRIKASCCCCSPRASLAHNALLLLLALRACKTTRAAHGSQYPS
jgi:hypothetical protein